LILEMPINHQKVDAVAKVASTWPAMTEERQN